MKRWLLILFFGGTLLADTVFDGTGDFATTASPWTTAINNVTIVATFKYSIATPTSGYIVFHNGTSASNGYGVHIGDGSCGAGNLICVVFGGVNCNVTTSAASVTNGMWTSVALVIDSGTTRLYVNGTQTSTTSSFTPNVPTAQSVVGGGSGGNQLPGTVANLTVYTSVLTPAQILAIHNSRLKWYWQGGNPANYYDFQQNGTVKDWKGGKDLTVTGAVLAGSNFLGFP